MYIYGLGIQDYSDMVIGKIRFTIKIFILVVRTKKELRCVSSTRYNWTGIPDYSTMKMVIGTIRQTYLQYVCMYVWYVCTVIAYSRVWINRVRLPILLVVS